MLPVLVAIGVGTLFVIAYWDELVDWLKDFCRRIITNLGRFFRFGAKLFAKIVNGDYSLTHRLFYKKEDKWYQQETIREVDESEVPAWAKEQVYASEKDVSGRYEQKLNLELS